MDPNGTLSVVVGVGGGWNCGSAGVHLFGFFLDNDAPCEGYIVQYVIGMCHLYDCLSGEHEFGLVTFFEAFKIPSNQKKVEFRVDTSTLKVDNDKCGMRVVYGYSKFYCKRSPGPGQAGTGDLDNNPFWQSRFHEDGCAQHFTNNAPSTETMPLFWTFPAVEEGAWRVSSVNFDCCFGSNAVSQFAHATPRYYDPVKWPEK